MIRKFISEEPENPETAFLIKQMGLAPGMLSSESCDEILSYFIQLLNGRSEKEEQEIEYCLKKKNYQDDFISTFAKKILKQEINAYKQQNNNTKEYKTTLDRLRQFVMGQEYAVKAAAGALVDPNVIKKGQNHSFLFIGPPGVGKTQLATSMRQIQKKYCNIQHAAICS